MSELKKGLHIVVGKGVPPGGSEEVTTILLKNRGPRRIEVGACVNDGEFVPEVDPPVILEPDEDAMVYVDPKMTTVVR